MRTRLARLLRRTANRLDPKVTRVTVHTGPDPHLVDRLRIVTEGDAASAAQAFTELGRAQQRLADAQQAAVDAQHELDRIRRQGDDGQAVSA